MYATELLTETYTTIADTHPGLQYRVQIMAGTEPLNKDGSPPHHEAQKK